MIIILYSVVNPFFLRGPTIYINCKYAGDLYETKHRCNWPWDGIPDDLQLVHWQRSLLS